MQKDPLSLRIVAAIIMAAGMTGSLLLACGISEGFCVFLIGSTLGVYWCYKKKTYTLMFLDIFYTASNIIGIYSQLL